MFVLTLFAVVCVSTSTFASVISPCKISDHECLEKTANNIIQKLVSDIPSVGTDSLDPMFIEKIEGNLSILKYAFYNSTLVGYKDCFTKNIHLNAELTSVHYELHCPRIHLTGKYEIDGRLIVLPVQGNGDFSLITGKYVVHVDSEIKTVQGSDGKIHFSIKNYKLKCEPLSPIKFDFKNLFNGQKDLSDAVHNFANQNWKEVAELVQEPTWYGVMKKIISNANKYFKSVSIEELIKS